MVTETASITELSRCTTSGTPPRDPACDLGHLAPWRAKLESLWSLKLDEMVLLSRACREATVSSWADGQGAGAGVSPRLLTRLDQSYRDLADLAAAITRIDAGGYGSCEECHQSMPRAWLDDEPQVRLCPDCSLELVRPVRAR
jgi:DnaK suppressor protein